MALRVARIAVVPPSLSVRRLRRDVAQVSDLPGLLKGQRIAMSDCVHDQHGDGYYVATPGHA